MTENKNLIEVKDMKIHFQQKGGKVVKAVDGITFSIRKGETFGIVGESGCGKSTLGRGILRLIEPTEGKVFYNGRDMSTMSDKEMKGVRQKIQIIFQDPSACLNPRRTMKQILMEPFRVHGIKDKEFVENRIRELVELVGLADYHLSRYPHELSGGQKQRIGIARALRKESYCKVKCRAHQIHRKDVVFIRDALGAWKNVQRLSRIWYA